MRVLFSGSRQFDDDQAVIRILEKLISRVDSTSQITIVHGGAAGLDSMVGVLAHHAGMTVEVHYANWQKHGNAAGVIRNQEMVDLGANMLVAYPLPGGRGTQDCIKRARKANIPTMIYDATTGTYGF